MKEQKLKRYKVTVKEIYSYEIEIDARSPEEAKLKVEGGFGDQVSPSKPESVLGRNLWDVEEVKNKTRR